LACALAAHAGWRGTQRRGARARAHTHTHTPSGNPLHSPAQQKHTQKHTHTPRYPGHLAEAGYNALHFNQLANSWVRDVRFVNADTAVYWWGVAFSSVQDVEVDTTK
jgi:hypothetical protein